MITRLVKEVVQRPAQSACRIAQRLTPGAFRKRLTKQARAAGFTRPVFLLSFDCDTERDFEVARDVHARLVDMGITAVYAVPGELLQAGEKTYGRIAEQGAEFINTLDDSGLEGLRRSKEAYHPIAQEYRTNCTAPRGLSRQ